jgi:hypothetical protein
MMRVRALINTVSIVHEMRQFAGRRSSDFTLPPAWLQLHAVPRATPAERHDCSTNKAARNDDRDAAPGR